MITTKHLSAGMSSIPQLQGTCNTFEDGLTAKLQSLRAVLNGDGTKVTEAIFDDAGAAPSGVGNLKLSEGGTNTAFIQNESKNILIGRS
jgi:hypothetical protein